MPKQKQAATSSGSEPHVSEPTPGNGECGSVVTIAQLFVRAGVGFPEAGIWYDSTLGWRTSSYFFVEAISGLWKDGWRKLPRPLCAYDTFIELDQLPAVAAYNALPALLRDAIADDEFESQMEALAQMGGQAATPANAPGLSQTEQNGTWSNASIQKEITDEEYSQTTNPEGM